MTDPIIDAPPMPGIIDVPKELKKTAKDLPFIPDRVKLLPISPGKFRLGLESTKENFQRVPGTNYRYEPDVKGNTYQTGLEFITAEERERIELDLGVKLDFNYYLELTYVMDGSNPHGHAMDLTKSFEKVVYLTMLKSKLIANGFIEYTKGVKPYADWYIENKESEAEAESKDIDVVIEATTNFKDLSNHKKVSFCKIFNLPITGLSPKVADNLLFKHLFNQKDPKMTKKFIDEFMDMCKWGDDKIAVYEEVIDAITKNIIRRNGAQDYVYGDDILGGSKEQVINKLLMGEHNGLRASIKTKINMR